MITPRQDNFPLYRGCTWEFTYQVLDESDVPLNLTDCTAELILSQPTVDATTILSAEYEINPSTGKVKFTITPAMTADDVWTQANFSARLLWPGGRVDKLGWGTFKLHR